MQLVDREKASELMKKQNIDLLLASTRPSVGYLSDYWHPVSDDYYLMWAVDATHKTVAGLPADTLSEPFLVAVSDFSKIRTHIGLEIRERSAGLSSLG